LADVGAAFGNRGNGLLYGWNAARPSADRNSSLSPDQRYDTHVVSGKDTRVSWELALPDGLYDVFLVAGDPGSSSGTYRFSLEDVPAIDGPVNSTNRWLSNRLNIVVADGRLSLSNLAGAGNNKICFIDILPVWPALRLNPSANGLATLSWTPETPGFMLQHADSLAPSPLKWVDAPSGAVNPVTIPTTNAGRFYRVVRP